VWTTTKRFIIEVLVLKRERKFCCVFGIWILLVLFHSCQWFGLTSDNGYIPNFEIKREMC